MLYEFVAVVYEASNDVIVLVSVVVLVDAGGWTVNVRWVLHNVVEGGSDGSIGGLDLMLLLVHNYGRLHPIIYSILL